MRQKGLDYISSHFMVLCVMNAASARRYLAYMKPVPSAERTWISRHELESRALATLRGLPCFCDLTDLDIESLDHAPAGSWHVARLWRGHVVVLASGPDWDAGGRAAIEPLRGTYRLDPRARIPG
jgi:hypothetical protein